MALKEPRRGCFRYLSGRRPSKGVRDWSGACRGQDLLEECYEEKEWYKCYLSCRTPGTGPSEHKDFNGNREYPVRRMDVRKTKERRKRSLKKSMASVIQRACERARLVNE
ncbi:MAG: hypothetical protein Q9204_004850 [Flavoplaca sp. TL-2023a]